jgi:hypothetical protein
MRTLAKILRTIGRWLTWRPAWEYAAPRQLGPWHYDRYPCYRYPSMLTSAADGPAVVAGPIQLGSQKCPIWNSPSRRWDTT